jgi:hypothetical protein
MVAQLTKATPHRVPFWSKPVSTFGFLLVRISANVTADFGSVTDSTGLALRGIDCRFPCQFWSSSGSRMLGLGKPFLSESPVSVIR